MAEPQAYLNGRFLPASQAAVSVWDGGFVQGTTVAEQLRTFDGELFQLEAHIHRLARSLELVGVDPGISLQRLAEIAQELAAANHALLAQGDDLGLTMFVTPGPYDMAGTSTPTVCLHTLPLRFHLWADKYSAGESMATTDVVQVSARSWPPELKCRSRMHYYLADRQARLRIPGSRALMTDEDGFVTEATTANIVLCQEQGLVMPPIDKILPGISLGVLSSLAEKLGIPCTHHDLTVADCLAASEIFLTSTSPCILPVLKINSQPIGGGVPGPVFTRFLSAWNELVELDIVEQARRFSSR